MVKKKNPPEPFWTKSHQRDDALRIMTKALVSDLWSEWRRAKNDMSNNSTSGFLPDANINTPLAEAA